MINNILKILVVFFIIFSVFLGKEMPIENIASKSITEIVPNKYLYSDEDEQQTLRNKRYQDFIRLMYRYAKYKEHPFPEAVAAQASYESRYGASEIARNANNIFGIKARKKRNGVYGPNVYRAITKEETKDGREDYLYQNFEAFEDLEENWKAYMRVINRDRYIRNGLREAKTNKEYITALKKGGYATEDDYINHLVLIIKRYKDLGLFY
jgi:flagellum-specific peptidoglycan hydrolase FlgJ